MPRSSSDKSLSEQVRANAKRPAPQPKKQNHDKIISSGSTQLNLACSDHTHGAFVCGTMVNLIGDSHTGKTLLALTLLAEAANDNRFEDYNLHYDDVERRLHFDLEQMFGRKMAARVKLEPRSRTVIEMHGNILDQIKSGKPFIWITDSLDALTTDEELEKAEKTIDARRKGEKTPGDYGMTKAKGMSSMLRMLCDGIEGTKSLIVVVSQTRQNINPMSFSKKTRAGGDALKFYCAHEVWLGNKGPILRIHKGTKYTIGNHVRAKITKNSITGKIRTADFDTYYDYGVDDTSSCISFLEEHKALAAFKDACGLRYKDTDRLVKEIEEGNHENKLHKACGQKWREIEDALHLERKKKYQ